MSDAAAVEGLRKHRHDLGQEDHGSKLAAGTTRGIQILLGMWITLTFGFVAYALIDAARPVPTSTSTSGTAAPAPAGQAR